jgi:hypothetical protein
MMTKHLLGGLAAFFLTSGIRSGRSMLGLPRRRRICPVHRGTRRSANPAPAFQHDNDHCFQADGDYRASTATNGVDAAGTTETRTKTETDPVSGTTTRSTTTTTDR